MDPLEKLREDVAIALGYHDGLHATFATAQESALHARHMGDNRTAIEIIDAFREAYEAVDVGYVDDGFRGWSTVAENYDAHTTIIVPRKRKPSLREAAGDLLVLCRSTAASFEMGSLDSAMDDVAAALQEEER